MDTFKRTPQQLFNLPQHFVIPLFQRTYVWKQEEQWEPLWKDVRRIAEARIAQPHAGATHFRGAVVIQAHESKTKQLTAWNVIDGQQRRTTLHLLSAAVRSVVSKYGDVKLAGQLERLTHNDEFFVDEGDRKSTRLNSSHVAISYA